MIHEEGLPPGSVSVPLSETSGSNAQERERKETHPQVVPSLPSADIRLVGSYRPQHDKGCAIFGCAKCGKGAGWYQHDEEYGFRDHDFAAKPCTCGLDAALARERELLLCQSEAQQEIAKLRLELLATSENLRAMIAEAEKNASAQRAAESLAAERQQEIERLQKENARLTGLIGVATDAHGGRDDLGPADRPQLPHDARWNRAAEREKFAPLGRSKEPSLFHLEAHRQPVVAFLRGEGFIPDGCLLVKAWSTRSGWDHTDLEFYPLARHEGDTGWDAIIGHHASGSNPRMLLGTCETLDEVKLVYTTVRMINGHKESALNSPEARS